MFILYSVTILSIHFSNLDNTETNRSIGLKLTHRVRDIIVLSELCLDLVSSDYMCSNGRFTRFSFFEHYSPRGLDMSK